MTKKININRLFLTSITTLLLVVCLVLISFSFIPKAETSSVVTKVFDYKTEPNHVIVPKIELNQQVYEGSSVAVLNKGPGYYDQNTDKPGIGNCVIFGHSATTQEHGAPFVRVTDKDLIKGDEIILTDKDNKTYKYKINEIKIISSADFSVVRPTDKPTVTLITCIPPDYPRDKRLVVLGLLE